MQNHRHLIAQRFQPVAAHIHAAHPDAAFGHIVQAADELDEGGFGGAGAADDADGLPRADVQVDVLQDHPPGRGRILEADSVKIHRPVGPRFHRVGRVGEGAALREDLGDAVAGLPGHGDHHKDHGHHHQAVEHHKAVGEQGRHLPHVQGQPPGGDDGIGAEGEHKHHDRIHTELHHGAVQCQDPLGPGEVGTDIPRCLRKLFFLVGFPHKGFDHPHGLDIFLHGAVQPVVFAEHLFEQGHSPGGDQGQPRAEKRHHEQKNPGHSPAHAEGHGKGKHQHQRRPDGRADDHHVGVLHVGHIGGHAGHQRGGGKVVDIFKGIVLDAVEQVFAQVAGQPAGGPGAGTPRQRPEGQRQRRHEHQQQPVAQHTVHIAAAFDLIHQFGDEKRYQALHDHLTADQQRRGQRSHLIFPDTAGQLSDHRFTSPFSPKKQKTGSGINWIYVIHTTRLFWVLSNCLL